MAVKTGLPPVPAGLAPNLAGLLRALSTVARELSLESVSSEEVTRIVAASTSESADGVPALRDWAQWTRCSVTGAYEPTRAEESYGFLPEAGPGTAQCSISAGLDSEHVILGGGSTKSSWTVGDLLLAVFPSRGWFVREISAAVLESAGYWKLTLNTALMKSTPQLGVFPAETIAIFGVSNLREVLNFKEINVYQVLNTGATVPAAPGAATYTFTSNTISFTDSASPWGTVFPSFNRDTQEVWCTTNIGSSDNALGVWATPRVVASESSINAVFLYSQNQPLTPSATPSRVPTGWHDSVAVARANRPDVNGTPGGLLYRSDGYRPRGNQQYTWEEPVIIQANRVTHVTKDGENVSLHFSDGTTDDFTVSDGDSLTAETTVVLADGTIRITFSDATVVDIPPGQQGASGANGANGRGISSVTRNTADGTIVINYDSGIPRFTSFSLPDSQGEERAYALTTTDVRPAAPSNASGYITQGSPDPSPENGVWYDDLPDLSESLPFAFISLRNVPAGVQQGATPYSSGTTYKAGFGPWSTPRRILRYPSDGQNGLSASATAEVIWRGIPPNWTPTTPQTGRLEWRERASNDLIASIEVQFARPDVDYNINEVDFTGESSSRRITAPSGETVSVNLAEATASPHAGERVLRCTYAGSVSYIRARAVIDSSVVPRANPGVVEMNHTTGGRTQTQVISWIQGTETAIVTVQGVLPELEFTQQDGGFSGGITTVGTVPSEVTVGAQTTSGDPTSNPAVPTTVIFERIFTWRGVVNIVRVVAVVTYDDIAPA